MKEVMFLSQMFWCLHLLWCKWGGLLQRVFSVLAISASLNVSLSQSDPDDPENYRYASGCLALLEGLSMLERSKVERPDKE